MSILHAALWTALIITSITTAVGLSLQTVVTSMIEGFWLHRIERRISPGDVITVVTPRGVESGEVTDLTIRVTVLMTPTGEEVLVPNTVIFNTAIVKNKDKVPPITITAVVGRVHSLIGGILKAHGPPDIPKGKLE